jgi:selenide, water dikinase
LSDALQGLQGAEDKNLLVGFETSDDAAVYRLSDDLAMINTIDFITPPVDDPYWFGQIAAANSISDVYSMGGRPLTALNVVMFPSKKLDMGILREMLRGGNDKVLEAGACLVGGHSVDDEEPKYGLCVNGTVHPDRIITNSGAQPGDALVLTKPLGSGVLFNAVRSGKLPFAEIEKEVLPIIAALNGSAIEEALKFDLHAATDITGFGVLGHAIEMSYGSGHEVVIEYTRLPIYPYAAEMYRKGETTGSNEANRNMVESKRLIIDCDLDISGRGLIYDPQTSGGLLLALPADQADALIAALHKAGISAAIRIGEVTKETPGVVVT